ncbi:hypothetical protein IT575_02385 [bacterium]|nr:hypothetical protein [bacterium]
MLNDHDLSADDRDEIAKLLARAIKDSRHALLVVTQKLDFVESLQAALQVRGATLVWVDENQVFTSERGWHRGFYRALGWHFPNEYNWNGLDDYLDTGPLMPQHGCVFYFSDFERHRIELAPAAPSGNPGLGMQELVLDMLWRHGSSPHGGKYFFRTLVVWSASLKLLASRHPMALLSWDPQTWNWNVEELPPSSL